MSHASRRTIPNCRKLPGYVALLFALVGCEPSVPLVAEPREPVVFVILEIGSSAPQLARPVAAVVTRFLSPSTVDQRPVEQFVMRRASDGRLLDWRAEQLPTFGPSILTGNYVLADSTSAAGLGRDSLVPGERYDLMAEIDGRVVNGTVTVPQAPVPRVLRGTSADTVVWSPVAGAAAYQLPSGTLSTDTLWVGESRPVGTPYLVSALDPQLARYLQQPELAQVGITGALGLFGAQVTVIVEGREGEP